jgi:hypothetical protein
VPSIGWARSLSRNSLYLNTEGEPAWIGANPFVVHQTMYSMGRGKRVGSYHGWFGFCSNALLLRMIAFCFGLWIFHFLALDSGFADPSSLSAHGVPRRDRVGFWGGFGMAMEDGFGRWKKGRID